MRRRLKHWNKRAVYGDPVIPILTEYRIVDLMFAILLKP